MNRLMALGSTIVFGIGLAACSSGQTGPAAAGPAAPGWAASAGRTVDHALARASTKLATRDITLRDRDDRGKSLPEAKITPSGELVIDGKPVALTPPQHAAVLAYRTQLVAVAQQGIVIGGQGARLGITAAGAALSAIFSGASTGQVQRRVEARAAGIKAGAEALCDALPALRAAQQRLAVEVPEFAPYATLTEKDVANCHTNGLRMGKTSA